MTTAEDHRGLHGKLIVFFVVLFVRKIFVKPSFESDEGVKGGMDGGREGGSILSIDGP